MKITLGPSDYFLPLIMTEIFDMRNFLSSDILFLWIEFIFGDFWIERFPKTDWGADKKFWKLSFEFKRGFKEEKNESESSLNACFAMRPTMSQTNNYHQKNTWFEKKKLKNWINEHLSLDHLSILLLFYATFQCEL